MEWIDCKDKLPPKNIRVLIAKYDHRKNVNMYFIQFARRYDDYVWCDDEDNIIDYKYGIITHWMPTPDKPGTQVLNSIEMVKL